MAISSRVTGSKRGSKSKSSFCLCRAGGSNNTSPFTITVSTNTHTRRCILTVLFNPLFDPLLAAPRRTACCSLLCEPFVRPENLLLLLSAGLHQAYANEGYKSNQNSVFTFVCCIFNLRLQGKQTTDRAKETSLQTQMTPARVTDRDFRSAMHLVSVSFSETLPSPLLTLSKIQETMCRWANCLPASCAAIW